MLINMNLENKIMNDIKAAMLSKDTLKLEVLRAIKSEILLVKTNKHSVSLTEEKENFILQKLLKQRKESQKIYASQGRMDLANTELNQANIILSYLPKPYTIEELEALVHAVMEELNITSKQDMGKLMSKVLKKSQGRADGKTISEIVKQKLDKKNL
tara:strand:+ start:609 stop:1079 length:471 start_codon:yes stop_codon:yes gene_type:complete